MSNQDALELMRQRKAEYDRALDFEDLFTRAEPLVIAPEHDTLPQWEPEPSRALSAWETELAERKVMAARLATYSLLSINVIATRAGLHPSTVLRYLREQGTVRPSAAPTFRLSGPTFHPLE